MSNIAQHQRADYGLDAPSIVRNFSSWGGLAFVTGLALLNWPGDARIFVRRLFGNLLAWTGFWFFLTGLAMFLSSRYGKLRVRDQLLDSLHLHGDETVLDVGCGHGLLLIGAAKRLPQGKAMGIDLWSQEDQGNNSAAATLANAQAEGVAERVELHTGNMMDLPFPDSHFDATVSCLAIHNIYNREGRSNAIGEIVRTLKPSGQVALLDFRHVSQYADDLRALHMQDVRVSSLSFGMYPPVRVVTARKA